MADFSNLRLQNALAEEEQEDELDRLMASNQASKPEVEAPTVKPAEASDSTLSDLLSDDDEVPTVVPAVKAERKPPATGKQKAERGMLTKPYRGGSKKGRKLPPRRRVGAAEALMLTTAVKFGVLTADQAALLVVPQKSNFGNPKEGQLLSVSRATALLRKLESMRLMEHISFKGKTYWGPLDGAIDAAREFGYLERESEEDDSRLGSMRVGTLGHSHAITQAAVELVSPKAFFRKSLGLEPVSINDLYSEPEIRRLQFDTAKELENARKNDPLAPDFGSWRNRQLDFAREAIKSGRYELDDLVDMVPELWTLGAPANEKFPVVGTHWPDFALRVSGGKHIFFEVERSRKSYKALEAILRTYRKEFEHGLVYERVIYFSTLPNLEKTLRQRDTNNELGLFSSNRIEVLRLVDGKGEPLRGDVNKLGDVR